MDTQHPATSEEVPDGGKKLLVMKGGGIKGLAYVGALEELEKHFEFNWYAGTSAGAISAVLLASGYSTDELKELLKTKDFRDFKDANLFRRILNLFTKGGLYEAHAFTNWLAELLAKKLDSPTNIRLSELPHRVTVYATKSDVDALVFDSTDPARKEVSAAFAARCSMSIPLIFVPQRSEGLHVMDGGTKHNYPVAKILQDNPDADFIGLYLGPENFEGIHGKSSIFGTQFKIWLESSDIEALRKYRDQTVVIDTHPISTLDFHLSEDEKQFLLECGRLSALKFLHKHRLIPDQDLSARREKHENHRKRLTAQRKGAKEARRSFFLDILLLIIMLFFLCPGEAGVTEPTFPPPPKVEEPAKIFVTGPDTFKILVLPFDNLGPDCKKTPIEKSVYKRYRDGDIRYCDEIEIRNIDTLGCPDGVDEARAIGKRAGADLVLYGNKTEKCHKDSLEACVGWVLTETEIPGIEPIGQSEFETVTPTQILTDGELVGGPDYIMLWTCGMKNFNDKNWEAALEVFQLTRQLFPDRRYDDLVLKESSCLYLLRRFAETAKMLEDHEFGPACKPIALSNLGVVYSRNFGEHERGLQKYEEAIALDPTNARIHDILARELMYFMKDYPRAQEEFLLALKYDPNNAEYHNSYGTLLMDKLSDTLAAKYHLEKSLSLNPNSYMPYLNLGLLHVKLLRDPPKAIEYLKQALRLDPNNRDAHYTMAQIGLQEIDDPDLALHHLQELIRIKPDDWDALNKISFVLATEKEKYAEAEKYLDRSLELSPGNTKAIIGKAYLYLKYYYDFPAAEKIYQNLLKENPDDVEALSGMGTIEEEAGNYKKAEAYHAQALALNPDVVNNHSNLGFAYLKQGKVEKAWKSFEKAKELDPEFKYLYFHLACYHAKKGEEDLAMSNLKKAWELGFHDLRRIVKEPLLEEVRQGTAYQSWENSLNRN